jgi:dGTPase
LQRPEDAGGLQLTYATLAGFTKYPTSSEKAHDKGATLAVSEKKHGFFQADSELFRQVAEGTGLLPKKQGHSWCRHPLALLVEAADDICYSIIDLEDGFHRGHIALQEAMDLLECVIDDADALDRLHSIHAPEEKLSFLRATAINSLVLEVAEEFIKREADILSGRYDDEILKSIPKNKAEAVNRVKHIDKSKVYDAREVIEIEVPGFDVLSGLLDAFVLPCEDVSEKGRIKGS